jgi:hypothetical protein
LLTNPDISDAKYFSEPDKVEFLLEAEGMVFNSGFFDNRSVFGSLTLGVDTLIFDIEYSTAAAHGAITNIKICDYDIKDGYYQIKDGGKTYFESALAAGRTSCEMSSKLTVSKQELLESKIGIFITASANTKIKKIRLYRKLIGKDGVVITPDTIAYDGKSLIS